MAKIITTDFRAIHDALNQTIIAEVKAALRLLPEQKIESEGFASLCRVVVSDASDYEPVDASVTRVWLDGDGKLQFLGTIHGSSGLFAEDNTDWLDITDFHYLIEQIKEQLPDGKTYNLCNMAAAQSTDDIMPSIALSTAIHKTLEY